MIDKKDVYPWVKLLMREKDIKDFSLLVHNYYKLANMRVMQHIRNKYNVPSEELMTLMMAIFSRMLNEAIYSIGANMRDGYSITDVYEKNHLMNLVRLLNGEHLPQEERTDIDTTDFVSGLNKFKEFVKENGKSFDYNN